MVGFLDSSSLVKLYHEEIDSDRTLHIIETRITSIYLSEITYLELRSAFWKKVRVGEISKEVAQKVIEYFEKDGENYHWIKMTTSIMDTAGRLLGTYGEKGLRSLDSIQLASALVLRENPFLFLTSDKLLRDTAEAENLSVN